MSVTNDLQAALVTDLQTITTTNSYNTAVAEVGSEPKRLDDAVLPAIYIISSSGEVDLETISNLQGECSQTFRVQMALRTATPNADMNKFLDDVRNAVERSSGAILAKSYVLRVTCTDWSSTYTELDIHDNVYIREADVVIDYVFTRGSA